MNSDQNGSVSKLLGSHKSNLCHFYIRLTSTLILYDIPSLRLSGATRSCWSTRNLKERVGPLNHQVQRKRNLALDESKYQTYDEYLCMAVDNCYIMFTHLDIIYYGIVCGFRPQGNPWSPLILMDTMPYVPSDFGVPELDDSHLLLV